LSPDSSVDFLIVGAGFSGLVAAERLSNAGFRCVVVDQRDHLGGNAHDRIDAAGVRVHDYGPHYFRTNSPRIVDYLSKFTGWLDADYKIKSFTEGRYWSFPVNLTTFEELVGHPAAPADFEAWLSARRVPAEQPRNSEELMLSIVGPELYRKFYEGYTLKQWRRHPRELDPSVCGRVPVRTNRDDRYLAEEFQALPADGYTAMFGRMLDASPGVELHLGVDFQEARRRWRHRHLIFTGPVDQYFDRRFGALPYRSLRFEHESFTRDQLAARAAVSGKPGFWQPAVQVNYPDAAVPHTRILEFKHITGPLPAGSSIIREFPKDWTPDDEPFYPVPADDAKAAYLRYAGLAAAEENTSFIGRLATYRYYNMDQVTGMALAEAARLISRYSTHA
jgi:UDP-galactopyranose mutase